MWMTTCRPSCAVRHVANGAFVVKFTPVTGMKWGRLVVNVNCALRRGAWYRVARIRSLEAILDVNRKPLVVPQYLVQIVTQPPRRWSVVPRPNRARELPPEGGPPHASGPGSPARPALGGRPG